MFLNASQHTLSRKRPAGYVVTLVDPTEHWSGADFGPDCPAIDG
jgi:hypothetical protein